MTSPDPFDDFEATVRTYQDVLLNYFVRKGVSYSDGQDLAQQTFVRLWKYRDRYEPTAKFTTFLFLLAGQVSVDFFRAEGRKRDLEDGYEAELKTVTDAVANGRAEATRIPLAGDDVRAAVAKLEPSFRDVVELGVFQDLPYAEVAEILAVPVGTVKSRMFYALKKLKELLKDER